MKVETTGDLRRVDLSPIVELWPALLDEWASLQFDEDGGDGVGGVGGAARNPLTGAADPALSLRGGRHRQAGAVYGITVDGERYEAALVDDDHRRLRFAIRPASERWTAMATIEHRPGLPTVEIDGQADLSATLRDDKAPGCLTAAFGGPGTVEAVIDGGALERSGRTVELDGRGYRLRGRGRVEVEVAGNRRWTVDGHGVLRGRGLARPLLWIFGGRIRRSLDRNLATAWASSESLMTDVEQDLVRLRVAIDTEGGAAPFVRRALWDDDFELDLATLRRLRVERPPREV